MIRLFLTASSVAILLLTNAVNPALADSFEERIGAAMASSSRPGKDKARDANRLPKETLAFFGVDSDQRVLEVLPGGGWYSRLLAPALEGTGQLYLAFAARMPEALRESEIMKQVEFLEVDAALSGTDHPGIFSVPSFSFGVENLDALLTFRNLHNLTADTRVAMAQAAFDALRPGGVYGVIDHTRRHNEPDAPQNWRRLDPVQMIQEIQGAGFRFEASSPLHARPVDALKLEVGDDAVTGQTDRFTLRFRKPAL